MKLKNCPFCSNGEIEVQRVGANKCSCIMICANCGCKLESNEIGFGDFWNKRPAEQELLEALKELVSCIKSGDLYQYTASQSWFFPKTIIMNNAFEKAKELIEKYEVKG